MHTDLDTNSNVVELAGEAVIRRDVNARFDCHDLSSEKTDRTDEKAKEKGFEIGTHSSLLMPDDSCKSMPTPWPTRCGYRISSTSRPKLLKRNPIFVSSSVSSRIERRCSADRDILASSPPVYCQNNSEDYGRIHTRQMFGRKS